MAPDSYLWHQPSISTTQSYTGPKLRFKKFSASRAGGSTENVEGQWNMFCFHFKPSSKGPTNDPKESKPSRSFQHSDPAELLKIWRGNGTRFASISNLVPLDLERSQ